MFQVNLVESKGNSQNSRDNQGVSAELTNKEGKVKRLMTSADPIWSTLCSQKLNEFGTCGNKYSQLRSVLGGMDWDIFNAQKNPGS